MPRRIWTRRHAWLPGCRELVVVNGTVVAHQADQDGRTGSQASRRLPVDHCGAPSPSPRAVPGRGPGHRTCGAARAGWSRRGVAHHLVVLAEQVTNAPQCVTGRWSDGEGDSPDGGRQYGGFHGGLLSRRGGPVPVPAAKPERGRLARRVTITRRITHLWSRLGGARKLTFMSIEDGYSVPPLLTSTAGRFLRH